MNAENIYLLIDGVESGPFTAEALHTLKREGRITPTTLCWQEGMAEWQELRVVFGETIQEKSAVRPPPPPAQSASIVPESNSEPRKVARTASDYAMMSCFIAFVLLIGGWIVTKIKSSPHQPDVAVTPTKPAVAQAAPLESKQSNGPNFIATKENQVPQVAVSPPKDSAEEVMESFEAFLAAKIKPLEGKTYTSPSYSHKLRSGYAYDIKKTDSLVSPFRAIVTIPIDILNKGVLLSSSESLMLTFAKQGHKWVLKDADRVEDKRVVGTLELQRENREFWISQLTPLLE